jgi:outer membrane protein assembly factor BamB
MGAQATGLGALRAGRLRGAAVASVVLLALAGCGQERARPSQHPPTGAWTAPDADLSNTRHVGGPIDAASVHKLKVAWRVPLHGLYAATPIVVGGVAYSQDLRSNVYAIDAGTGRVLWTRIIERDDDGPNGVNVANGRVYGVLTDGAIALDARSGALLWHERLLHNERELVVMTPGLHDGTLYVSTNPGTGGAIGTLWALDAATGRRIWKWEEVPRSLWGHPKLNAGGGLWHPPAFDERGSLYVSIANPLPFPGLKGFPWGSSRPGPNRWDDSIVKLDARTGRFLWGNQVLPHDLYDWDLQAPVILARTGARRLALTAGKMGFVYAFDADTGALVWKRSVGLHNGHDDDNLLAMRGRYERLRLNVKLYPGTWGGVQTPMASDGTTVYVPVVNLYATFTAQRFAEMKQQEPLKGTGELVALDVASGRVKWDRVLPHSPYGAATVVNDLVFTTTLDGTLWAISTRTGAVVWRSQLPAGTDAPVAVAGDTLITAGSMALASGQSPQIVAYRLAG